MDSVRKPRIDGKRSAIAETGIRMDLHGKKRAFSSDYESGSL